MISFDLRKASDQLCRLEIILSDISAFFAKEGKGFSVLVSVRGACLLLLLYYTMAS